MKRSVKLLLCLMLVLCLLPGCAAEQNTAPTETTAAAETSVKVVSTVDELLAAIGSDTEIVMEAGTYDLSTASDYGRESANSAYIWEEVSDGYALKLRGVQNLKLQGSGNDLTELTAAARYADVLILQNCTNVTLEDFTAGHVKALPGECSGGVLVVQGSMNVTMNRLGLYGCGVIGLQTEVSTNVSITDSDIYDCSNSAFNLYTTDGIVIDNCRVYDIGDKQYGGYTLFNISSCSGVEITNCDIRDNVVTTLLSVYPGKSVVLKNNAFTGNRLHSCAFSVNGSSMVMDGNTFEDNNIRIWFEGTGAVDAGGTSLTEEMMDELYPQSYEEAVLPEQTEVHVSTVDEFIAAIAPNTKIVLDAALYDFSTATGYGETTGDYYCWEDIFDGPGLVITGVDNLTICSGDGSVKGHTLAAVPRYANVLTFTQCSNITLEGFTAGHTEEPGYCTGGVLCFRDCDSVLVNDCSLYGCGTLGVEAEYSGNISVTNCEIYECSYGGIRMWSVDGAAVENCTFRDLGGSSLSFSDCKNVTVDGASMPDTFYSED